MTSPLAGRYRLIRSLAVGGMGEVFLAVQEGPAGFSRPVVVKRVLKHLSANPEFIEMFLNEARVAALLSHPSIVQLLELGQDEEGYFIAMELVHGVTLRALLKASKAKPMPPALGAYVAAQALEALHYAHQLKGTDGRLLKLVHRDVSPDNVMLSHGGNVKLLDFGIAKAQAAASSLTRPGTVKGKYAYLPPEAFSHTELDSRADVYAMGVVLQEALTGTRPFEGPTEPALLNAILHDEPTLPSAAVPATIAAVIRRAIARSPDDRFPSAQAMAAELERYLKEHGGQANAASLAHHLVEVLGPEASRPLSLEPIGLPTFLPPGQATQTHAPDATVLQPRPRRLAAALALAAAVTAGVAGVLYVSRQAPTASPGPVPTPSPVVVAVQPQPEPAPAPAPTPEPDSPAEPQGPAERRLPNRQKGKVVLRIKPWAEVFVNGQRLGVTPLPDVSLPAGNAVFTLKNDELKVSRQVKVKVAAGRETVLKTDLREP